MKKNTKIITRVALMLALSMVLSYVEHLLNFNIAVPGVKPGTANIVCLFALYSFTWYEALGVHLGRIALSALLFGNTISFMYSLVGGICAFFAMWLLKRTKLFGVVGASVFGGVMHSIGQLCVAAALTGSAAVFSYLPLMLLFSTLFGTVTGSLCTVVLKRTKNNKKSIDKGV